MPLDKLVLICVCVLGAFGITLWLAALVLTALQVPAGWLALIRRFWPDTCSTGFCLNASAMPKKITTTG